MTSDMYDRGLEIRREVLGAEHVDPQIANADDFNRPLQRLLNVYCWGEIWGDETLSRKTRSMLNIAMISALNRSTELRTHIRGALRNGVSKDEIRAILMHVAIYCGMPAAVEGFRIARDAFKEEAK